MAKKTRLDVAVFEQGYAESREKAKAIIMAGLVYVNNQKADKAGFELNVDVAEVAKIISDDIASHAKYSTSEKKFAFIYSCAVLTNALEATLREARESERAELEDFLLRRMGSEDARLD